MYDKFISFKKKRIFISPDIVLCRFLVDPSEKSDCIMKVCSVRLINAVHTPLHNIIHAVQCLERCLFSSWMTLQQLVNDRQFTDVIWLLFIVQIVEHGAACLRLISHLIFSRDKFNELYLIYKQVEPN